MTRRIPAPSFDKESTTDGDDTRAPLGLDKDAIDSAKDCQNSRQNADVAVGTGNADNITNRGQTSDCMEVSETPSDVTTIFAFDDTFFDACDDECTYVECSRRRLHKKASEMKQVLRITRFNGCQRCHVLLKNGERLVCRPVQVPSHLLCAFRLRKYYKRQ